MFSGEFEGDTKAKAEADMAFGSVSGKHITFLLLRNDEEDAISYLDKVKMNSFKVGIDTSLRFWTVFTKIDFNPKILFKCQIEPWH